MARNKVFPQCGIITALDASGCQAKVFIPLWKIETNYIKISKVIPIKQAGVDVGLINGSQVVVSFINGDIADGIITGWV